MAPMAVSGTKVVPNERQCESIDLRMVTGNTLGNESSPEQVVVKPKMTIECKKATRRNYVVKTEKQVELLKPTRFQFEFSSEHSVESVRAVTHQPSQAAIKQKLARIVQ